MKDSSSWLCHKFLKGRKCTLNISAKTDAILNNCKPNEASCEDELQKKVFNSLPLKK